MVNSGLQIDLYKVPTQVRDAIRDKLQVESPHAVYAVCDIMGVGVSWNGHIFEIDLYKVPTQVRDAIRAKEPVCMYNQETEQSRIGKYDHSVITSISSREYVYRATNYPSENDIRIVITNVD